MVGTEGVKGDAGEVARAHIVRLLLVVIITTQFAIVGAIEPEAQPNSN